MSGRDAVGIAETGSGKTLAFLLPAFVHIQELKKKTHGNTNKPFVLVIAPTRELAQQIADTAEAAKDSTGVSGTLLENITIVFLSEELCYMGSL